MSNVQNEYLLERLFFKEPINTNQTPVQKEEYRKDTIWSNS